MAILDIKTYPDPILRQKADPVRVFDDDLKKLARDMAETMYAAPGVGLAANQVGIAIRMIVVDVRGDAPENATGLVTLVNPEIVEAEGEQICDEGCLSLPEERAEVRRFDRVVVRAQDVEGNEFEIEAEGFPAVVFQHEIDHLNGVLFMDHVSAVKRTGMKKRLRRLKQQQQADAG